MSRYKVAYVPGLNVYGIVSGETGQFEPFLYYTDAASAEDQAEFMNEQEEWK